MKGYPPYPIICTSPVFIESSIVKLLEKLKGSKTPWEWGANGRHEWLVEEFPFLSRMLSTPRGVRRLRWEITPRWPVDNGIAWTAEGRFEAGSTSLGLLLHELAHAWLGYNEWQAVAFATTILYLVYGSLPTLVFLKQDRHLLRNSKGEIA